MGAPLTGHPPKPATFPAHRSFTSTLNIYTKKNPIKLKFCIIILYNTNIPYTEEDLREAIEAVATSQSIRKTVLTWGIFRITFQNRLYNSESRKQAHLYKQRLPLYQEQRLVDWILLQNFAKYLPTYIQIRDLIIRIFAITKDINPLKKKWI